MRSIVLLPSFICADGHQQTLLQTRFFRFSYNIASFPVLLLSGALDTSFLTHAYERNCLYERWFVHFSRGSGKTKTIMFIILSDTTFHPKFGTTFLSNVEWWDVYEELRVCSLSPLRFYQKTLLLPFRLPWLLWWIIPESFRQLLADIENWLAFLLNIILVRASDHALQISLLLHTLCYWNHHALSNRF